MLEIVLPDHTRLSLAHDVTIGRAAGSTVRLEDHSVSRRHARISALGDGHALLEDTGSSYGTWLDGLRIQAPTPLRAGARIRVGNQELVVDRQRGENESGRTIVVSAVTAATRFGGRPHLRGGYALKRLESAEGDRRWVLKDVRAGRFVRMSDADATLFGLLDGSRTLAELVREAERAFGPAGRARLVILLAALADKDFLADGPGTAGEPAALRGPRRLLTPRTAAWPGAAAALERLHRRGGWALLTRPAVAAWAALSVIGAAVFVYLIFARYGTPFVVASRLGIGGLVFIVGRLAVAAVHEMSHGLVMSSFGRPVREAGLKLVLVFPYFYVDTSDAWFEPRRRRIAVSAAGPASDLCLGGTFALTCLVAAPGTVRDVLFQVAFGAYVGAFFNLNPLMERDGYHILVDVLREPGLRRRARDQVRRRIAGERRASDSVLLARYAWAGLAWSLLGAGAAAAMSLRYEAAFAHLVPPAVIWTVIVGVWLVLLVPVLAIVAGPARQRLRTWVA